MLALKAQSMSLAATVDFSLYEEHTTQNGGRQSSSESDPLAFAQCSALTLPAAPALPTACSAGPPQHFDAAAQLSYHEACL